MSKKIFITLGLSSGLLFAADLYTTRSDCTLSDGSVGTILELEMGDDSCDGHCMTEVRNICSNLNPEQISAAYAASEEKVGFNFIQDVAEEYEDNSLSMEKLKTLRENGIAAWQFEDERYAEEGEELESVSLDSDTYSQIYLELVKLGNAEFKHDTLQGKNLSIGGYGLFSH